MCYTVYILSSDSCGKFYTGQTQDFDNRLESISPHIGTSSAA